MTQQMETNIQNQILQSLFLVREQRQFCLMQGQKNYILVHISRKLPLISNMLIRNISYAGIRLLCPTGNRMKYRGKSGIMIFINRMRMTS